MVILGSMKDKIRNVSEIREINFSFYKKKKKCYTCSFNCFLSAVCTLKSVTNHLRLEKKKAKIQERILTNISHALPFLPEMASLNQKIYWECHWYITFQCLHSKCQILKSLREEISCSNRTKWSIQTQPRISSEEQNCYKLENLFNNLKNEPKKTFMSSIHYLFQPKCRLTANSTTQRVQTPYCVKLDLNVTTYIIHNNISSQDKWWAKHEIKSATHQIMA